MLRLRSIFVGRLGYFCSVGQRTCRRTTLTAGEKWARLSGIPLTGQVSREWVSTYNSLAHKWLVHSGNENPFPRAGERALGSPVLLADHRVQPPAALISNWGI